uniref:G_PROTEIN_RECEP_F1_2 domain-containing protein n=1 Tax=Panagrellus redivivus TaxID=6233 RepID=A0A7E4VRJ7_PANRE
MTFVRTPVNTKKCRLFLNRVDAFRSEEEVNHGLISRDYPINVARNVARNVVLAEVTRWHCYKNFCNQLFIITTPALGLLTLANALDRVYLVSLPGKYNKLGPLYPLAIVGVIAAIIVPIEITAFLQAYYDPNAPAYAICAPADALSPMLQIAVRVIFKTSGLFGQSQKREMKLTLTIALITLSQLCMFTIPDIFILLDSYFLLFHIVNLSKGIFNIFIIVLCQQEIRRHILRCGKQSNSIMASKTPPKVPAYNKSTTVTAIN